jgi:hypothetical protein
MQNVRDFFQKNKKENEKAKKGKSHPVSVTEQKQRFPREARFRSVDLPPSPLTLPRSIDQRGREIHNFFAKYLTDYSLKESPSLFIKQQFISFADEFVGLYEPIIDLQRNEPLNCEDDREPKLIEDTWGHPTQFVVHVAQLLLEYIPSFTDPPSSTEILDFTLKWVFDEEAGEGRCLDSYERQIYRHHLLRVLYTLSIICFWPHNRNILLEYLGKDFVRVLLLITRIFISKVEEVIVEIIDLNKHQEAGSPQSPPNPARTTKLNEDAIFILHTLMASVHVFARGSPGLVRCLGPYNTFYFPHQPWNTQQRMQMGYFDMSPSPVHEPRPLDHISSLSRIDTSSAISEFQLPQDLYAQFEGNFEIPEEDSTDGWSFVLIQCGALRALISLLSKLIYLSKALSSPSLYLLSAQEDHSLSGRSHLKGFAVTWRSSVSLQCEVIVAILAFTLSQPISTIARLHLSDGFSITNTLLSMMDCPAIELLKTSDFQLGMHRSFLCLRLTEIILSWSVKDHNSHEIALRDILQSFDNLQNFFSWIHLYITHSKLNVIDGPPGTYRDVSVQVTNLSSIPTSSPRSDLWPWTNSSDSQSGLNNCDELRPPVEIDLCDWGGVMLGYAGTESLLSKYIRSMKQSELYSLRAALIDVFEGTNGTRNYLLPWFVKGFVSEIWDQVFSVLYSLCKATLASSNPFPRKQSSESESSSQDYRNQYLTAILTEIFQSLSYCILAPTITIQASPDDGNKNHSPTLTSSNPLSQFPTFQMHMVHFVGACLDFNSEIVINVSRLTKMWMLLSTSSCFLLGGQEEISNLFRYGKRLVEIHGTSTATTWCLHCNSSKGFESPKIKPVATFRSPPVRMESGKESLLQEEDLSDSDLRSIRARHNTLESDPMNEISFDVDDPSPILSPMRCVERPQPASLLLDLEMEKDPSSDQMSELSDATLLGAFAWLTLGDSIMQLMSQVVEIQFNNKSQKLAGPTLEVLIILQAINKETPDHVMAQTMAWLQNTLCRLNPVEDSDKIRQVLFKCVSLCKYQLLSCCDPSQAIPLNDTIVPFWIGDEIEGISQIRPLLWSARCACLRVIETIILSQPGENWIKTFLPKPLAQVGDGSGYHYSKAMVTPKYATFLLLILDPKCRQVSLRLLIEVLHVCTCLVFNLPQRNLHRNRSGGGTSGHLKLSKEPTNPQLKSLPDSEGSKTIYHAIFHDVVKYLLVSHVKYALLQPVWCDGPGIVASVCQWIKSLLCDPDRSSYLVYYQSMFLQYGPTTHYHQQFNWTKPRPNIFRELLLSLDECFRISSQRNQEELEQHRKREIQIQMMRHFLSLLTALMLDSVTAKSKFSSLMTLRKFSKNKAKVTSSIGIESANKLLNPTNPCNIHDVATLIVSLEGSPSVETILILFDMLLDGPKQNNRSYIIQAQIASSVGMFFQENTKVCFSNLTVISILLLLIPSCTEEVQTFICSTLKNLLIGRLSLVNLSKCRNMAFPILDSLIDLFPVMPKRTLPLCAKLMHIVGKHNVTVAQLKRIFRLMHVMGDYRPQYTSLLLQCLRLMVNSSKMPKHFFLFEGGPSSGVKIPPIYRWPAGSGYSFCCWFSVQNDNTTALSVTSEGSLGSLRIVKSQDENYDEFRPTLLSFRQNSGIGVEVFLCVNRSVLNGYSVVLQTHRDISEGIEPSRVMISSYRDGEMERPILGGEWNFFAFAHTPGKFRGRSEAAILLNSSLSRHHLSFPRYLGEIEEPIIGDVTPALAVPASTAFRGQVGSFYFFAEALNELQMRKIYQLGMDVSHEIDTTAINKRLLHTQSAENSSAMATNLEALSSSVMLAYYPGVGDGVHVLDMSPEKNSNRWSKENTSSRSRSFSGQPEHERRGNNPFKRSGGKMDALMLTGCHRCTFKDMRDALDCLGGKRVLIPLFAQVDLPTLDPMTSIPNYSIDTKLCEEIVQLSFALSREKDDNAPQFELMAYFLERISPKYLTSQLLQIFLDNVRKFPTASWSGPLIKHLLLHFKLWRSASFETQHRLFVYLLLLCQQDPLLMRSLVGIRELFDILELFYSSVKDFLRGESDVSDGISDFSMDMDDYPDQSPRLSAPNLSLNIPNPSSPSHPRAYIRESRSSEESDEKLSEPQIEEIRKIIFQMVFVLMNNTAAAPSPSTTAYESSIGNPVDTPSPEEVQCIMYYLSNVSAPASKLQTLSLLLSLLATTSKSLQRRLVAGFECGVKIFPLLALHLHPNLKTRLYAFLAFCNILQLVIQHGILPAPKLMDRKETFSTPNLLRGNKMMNSPESTFESFQLEDVEEISTVGDSESEDGVCEEFLQTASRKELSPKASATPKHSYSFISPTNLSAKGFFREQKPNPSSMDTFESIGVPISSLRYVLTWIEFNLLAKEDVEGVCVDYDAHCKVIVNIMSLTMVGQPSIALRTSIDNLFIEFGRVDSSREDSVNENLSESIFCLPSFLPAIIRFISRDIVSYSLRFSTLVGIKTKLQTFKNCDSFLQVPDWQIALFELLSMEQSRIEHLKMADDAPNRVKDINRSSGIIDTATRMLCELFVHCVEYGCPASDSVVQRPSPENSRSHPKPTPLVMVQEISKGKRIFAPVVLKETIGYLKCYARRSELDVNNVAVSFLQQIINALTLRRESWKTAEVKEEYQQYIRGRAFNVCCWLTASFILEFVTSPIVTQNPETISPNKVPKVGRRRTLSSTPPNLNRAVSAPQESPDLQKAPHESFSLDIDYIHETYDPTASRVRSWSASRADGQLNVHGSETFPSLNAFQMGAVDKSSSKSLWDLLESIIYLLESLGNIQGNAQARIRIALSLGIKSSNEVLDVVNDAIDDSLPSTTAPLGMTETDLEKKLLAIPIRKISAMICWRIVRILCNIYCSNASSRGTLTPSQQALQTDSIKKLEHIINVLEVKDWGSPRFEILLTVARIVSVLKQTSHRPVDQWVQDSFQLLTILLEKSHEDVVGRLCQVGFSFVEEIEREGSQYNLSQLSLLSIGGSHDGDDEIDIRKVTGLISDTPTTDGRKITADLVLRVITRTLQIPADMVLTWTIWEAAMAHVIADGVRMEDEALSGTLTEFGLDKGSLFAAHQLESFRSEEESQFSLLAKRCQVVAKKASEHEVNALKKRAMNIEASRKRNLVRWNLILEDLANERGPWGVGAEEEVEVSVAWQSSLLV